MFCRLSFWTLWCETRLCCWPDIHRCMSSYLFLSSPKNWAAAPVTPPAAVKSDWVRPSAQSSPAAQRTAESSLWSGMFEMHLHHCTHTDTEGEKYIGKGCIIKHFFYFNGKQMYVRNILLTGDSLLSKAVAQQRWNILNVPTIRTLLSNLHYPHLEQLICW